MFRDCRVQLLKGGRLHRAHKVKLSTEGVSIAANGNRCRQKMFTDKLIVFCVSRILCWWSTDPPGSCWWASSPSTHWQRADTRHAK